MIIVCTIYILCFLITRLLGVHSTSNKCIHFMWFQSTLLGQWRVIVANVLDEKGNYVNLNVAIPVLQRRMFTVVSILNFIILYFHASYLLPVCSRCASTSCSWWYVLHVGGRISLVPSKGGRGRIRIWTPSLHRSTSETRGTSLYTPGTGKSCVMASTKKVISFSSKIHLIIMLFLLECIVCRSKVNTMTLF